MGFTASLIISIFLFPGNPNIRCRYGGQEPSQGTRANISCDSTDDDK